MVAYCRSRFEVFMRYRHLLKYLVQRDIKVKYRRSALGLLWSVLNPLLMMLVMTMVFSYLFRTIMDPRSLPSVSATGQPPSFPVYLLSGQLIFNFFNEATNSAMDSVLGSSALIRKVYIPKYIFPLEKVLFSFINALFSMIAFLGVILVVGAPFTGWFLLFWLPLLLLFIFNLGVGLVLSSLVVFFRDIKHLYSVLVLALTYMTPIFYPESMLGENPYLLLIIRMNPVYWYVSLFRQLTVYGRAPTPYQLLFTIGWAAVVLLLGLLIFRKTQDRFILYM